MCVLDNIAGNKLIIAQYTGVNTTGSLNWE